MCQYSCASSVSPPPAIPGALTDYHLVHLGQFALKGAALTIIEATAVQDHGRISPHDAGLWMDEQIPGMRVVADFVHSQGGAVGIQLAHSGRKGSTVPPWIANRYLSDRAMKVPGSVRADKSVGGWPESVVGPSGGPEYAWDLQGGEGGCWSPREMTTEDVEECVRDWAKSAGRAVRAGMDMIEIHAAHGYLLNQFLSPITNKRNDKYGGSWENRVRILIEIIGAVRETIPQEMPLFLRVSGTEWLEGSDVEREAGGSWSTDDSIRLAKMLPSLGVDLLDVSSGGNHPSQKIEMHSGYQIGVASQIRKAIRAEGVNLLIGAVGLITDADQARGVLEDAGYQEKSVTGDVEKEALAAKEMVQKNDQSNGPKADVILVARQFMREPEWVLKVAWKLGIEVAWPSQFGRAKFLT
ncbi:MAG: hypothetical protein Q9227_008170 [Pyrenula ochraceoflavens]